ncbi:MAG TPA: MBL fold metallo-hydrolase, partial [Steroidobacteraceae bacterium]
TSAAAAQRTLAPRLTRHPDGITAIDAEYFRPGFDAVHLIVHGGRAAFVDSGTSHSVPHLLAALDELGVAREAVDFVFLTHVHLDHAGGAGSLMRALPLARAVLHPRGAPHLTDPARLIAASIAVYGEENYRRSYGEIVPIAAARVLITSDGQRLTLAGREFDFLHTPGHALHHQSIVDYGSRSIFTGDTFGVSYRELDTAQGEFIIPTTTPTQFDPQQLLASIERLLGCFAPVGPRAMYLTHYSRVIDVARLGADLKFQVSALAELARRHAGAADRAALIGARLRELVFSRARAHGCVHSDAQLEQLLGPDLDLNTQGLIAWLERHR